MQYLKKKIIYNNYVQRKKFDFDSVLDLTATANIGEYRPKITRVRIMAHIKV